MKAWADRIGQAYNDAFVNNWEYYPLTAREIKFILDNILVIADPKLIKIITHGDQVVGFLMGFHDVSAGLQKARGRLLPFGLLNILLDKRRTKWVAMNGAGILPEFQGRGRQCAAVFRDGEDRQRVRLRARRPNAGGRYRRADAQRSGEPRRPALQDASRLRERIVRTL